MTTAETRNRTRRMREIDPSPTRTEEPTNDPRGSSRSGGSGGSIYTWFFRKSILILTSTFHTITSSSPSYTPSSSYSTILHSRPWVYYHGVSTYVPISILGSEKALPEGRRIVMQKRGWRTGVFGWSVGAMLGGAGRDKEVDVTPEIRRGWGDTVTSAVGSATSGSEDLDGQQQGPELSEKRKKAYDDEIKEFLSGANTSYVDEVPKDHHALETSLIRIPVSSGDGYFRFLIYPPSKPSSRHTPLAYTSTFRLGSLSLASSQPRGASPITLIPELLLKSASLAAWTGFWAMFPVLKVVEMIPGPSSRWGRWAIERAWKGLGGTQKVGEVKERYRIDERRREAEERVYSRVPFGTAGVRTAYDLRKDKEMGIGGVCFVRT